MATIKRLTGQSNYDICLQAYGSLDMLFKLCIDNNISNVNVAESKDYIFDENLVVDKNITGYKYATGS